MSKAPSGGGKRGKKKGEMTDALKEKIVQNVQTFLEHTKEERAKRGQYMSFDKNDRNNIKEYAIKFGAKETARIFSVKLGQPIAESTVRSIASDGTLTSDQLKLQIGEYGSLFGEELAAKHFTNILGRPITAVSVGRYIKMFEKVCQSLDYTTKSQDENTIGQGEEQSQDLSLKTTSHNSRIEECKPSTSKKVNSLARGKYVRYDAKTRESIVLFARERGIAAASRHFSEQLGSIVSESTIRSMRDQLNKYGKSSCRRKGRPTKMGSNDVNLLHTLKRLQEAGEPITSFTVIATAKQMRDELNIAEDSELTKTWAKSVIARFNKYIENESTKNQ
eukprot:TRINITY_DN9164_c0_g1_i4.p1 TRINITY_DN9164_c0_g1~~TRINITY_DN9164_c0_g1_i4.p1  ORF type:complete len:342 (-),score=52.15 TRINITY_DN9164_c0_g1_i4:88-1089(-)